MVDSAEFPLPFGVSGVYFHQEQEYVIEKLTLGVPGLVGLPTNLLRIDNEIDETNAKFDAWLLPWLNVFGIAGKLDGETNVDFSALGPALQLPFTRLTIEYDGEVYGGGAVVAGGTD
ncbi:MAG: TonB-dependent receptor, partial [Candidatus Binatia bacterium]